MRIAATHWWASESWAAVAGAVWSAASSLLASEEVESVDDVQHCVAVDRVILHVAAAHCRYGAREVALVLEDVVELERDGQCTSAHKTL